MARIISVKIFMFVEARAVCGYMKNLDHTFQHYAVALRYHQFKNLKYYNRLENYFFRKKLNFQYQIYITE